MSSLTSISLAQMPLHSEVLHLAEGLDPSSWSSWPAVGQRHPSCLVLHIFNTPVTIQGMWGLYAKVKKLGPLVNVVLVLLVHIPELINV